METTTRLNEAADVPRTRRALLAGVIGGLGAFLASAAQRVMPVEARMGDPIRIGQVAGGGTGTTGLRATTGGPAFRAVQMGGGTGIYAESTSGRAVVGMAGSQGTGLWGSSPDHIGVFATTNTGIAVNGRAVGRDSVALFGDARGTNAFAVLGFGPSHFDGDVTVNGRLFVTNAVTFEQTAAPQAPRAGEVRLFAKQNGWGKTQICVQYPSGAVQTLATEP
jgi:hypothetical protein